jgi:hypothetical protein
VLYLHNHGRKMVSEQHRSKDIDEIVDVLKEKMNYRTHFNNAISNYMPVIHRINELCDKYPEVAEEQFPEDWEDPLDLYGCLAKEMLTKGMDLDYERGALRNLLKDHEAEWVWENRRKLVAERIFIDTF